MRSDKELTYRNFGLTEKSGRLCSSMNSAVDALGREAVFQDKARGALTIENWRQAVNKYVDFAKEHGHPFNNLKSITPERHMEFAKHIADRVRAGLSVDSGHKILSAINSVLRLASCNKNCSNINPKDVGIPNRTAPRYDQSVSQEKHDRVVAGMRPVPAAMAECQRQLGLRWLESAKANYRAMAKAIDRGDAFIRVTEGTKEGKPRTTRLSDVPATREKQIAAIKAAAALQGNAKSFAAQAKAESGKSLLQFKRDCNKDYPKGYKPHGERHAYAHRAYEEKTGQRPMLAGVKKGDLPAGRGSKDAYKRAMAAKTGETFRQFERRMVKAYKEISLDMGHCKHDKTSRYLG